MKAFYAAAAVLLAATALSPMARAEGPRPSSGTNWPGMSASATDAPVAAVPDAYVAQPAEPGPAPHYVWHEGYESGGKWRAHWVLVP
jgi:hypothetical protein